MLSDPIGRTILGWQWHQHVLKVETRDRHFGEMLVVVAGQIRFGTSMFATCEAMYSRVPAWGVMQGCSLRFYESLENVPDTFGPSAGWARGWRHFSVRFIKDWPVMNLG